MGYLEQDVFVATSWDRNQVSTLEKACRDIGLQILGPTRSEVNCHWTIVVPTSGSKSGRQEKERYGVALQGLIQVARELDAVHWFWASYGGDRNDVVINEYGPTPIDVERNEARYLRLEEDGSKGKDKTRGAPESGESCREQALARARLTLEEALAADRDRWRAQALARARPTPEGKPLGWLEGKPLDDIELAAEMLAKVFEMNEAELHEKIQSLEADRDRWRAQAERLETTQSQLEEDRRTGNPKGKPLGWDVELLQVEDLGIGQVFETNEAELHKEAILELNPDPSPKPTDDEM